MISTRAKIVIAVVVTPLVLFGIGGALALSSSTAARLDKVASSSIIVPKSWADQGAEQLAALPVGTQIVNCTPTQKRMQPGVTSTPADGSPQLDPGFHFLTDGRCALSPSSISTAAERASKTFDIQWFGTGLDGGPAIGGSSCFVGDALDNHCGIETNVRSHPGMMATGGPFPPKPSAP